MLGRTRASIAIDVPIAAILILNTTAHTVGATVAGAEFAVLFGDHRIGVFSGVFTYLMLQFTEILPKTVGVRYNRDAAVWERPGPSTAWRLTSV